MEIGIYKGAASLAAYEKWQEMISQNIAASAVPGFKKNEVAFSAMTSGQTRPDPQNKFSDVMNGVMPTTTTSINFSQGELRNSGSDLDFAIQGPGFFQVQRGNGDLAYTRDGEFHLGPDRTLLNKDGLPVMGESGPIVFKSGGGAVSINAEGTVLQGNQNVGKLPVYNFSDTGALQRLSSGLFAPADAGTQPEVVEKADVLNGFVEGSNVSALTEMVNLITVSRAYEASQKVIQSSDDSTEKAIQVLGSPNT